MEILQKFFYLRVYYNYYFQDHNGNQVDIEVQFNFSIMIKCNRTTPLNDLKKIIHQQSIPDSIGMM